MTVAAISTAAVAIIGAIASAVVTIRNNGKVNAHLTDHAKQASPK